MLESYFDAIGRFGPFEWILTGLLGTVFLLKMIFLFLFTGRGLFRKQKAGKGNQPVSLILTLRNEEENLGTYLPAVLETLPRECEVVAVDDFSQDGSLTVLGMMKEKYKNLRLSALSQETRYSEKLAQNIALKAAQNEWVLVIPPSVAEAGSRWINSVSSRLNGKKEIVVNYSNLNPANGFFHILYRAECFWQQVRSFGFIMNGLPYVNFEENVAFRKENYFRSGGFGKKVKEPYANLELLINSFMKRRNTEIHFSRDAALRKKMPVGRHTFFELIQKEIRIRKFLPFFRRFILFIESLLHLLYLPLFVLAFFVLTEFWPVWLALLVIHLTAFSFIIKILLNRLNERNLFLSSFMVGLMMPWFKFFYQGYFIRNSRRQKWKSKR